MFANCQATGGENSQYYIRTLNCFSFKKYWKEKRIETNESTLQRESKILFAPFRKFD